MRILFCDDDSKILAQLQKYVCEYFEKGKLKRPEMKVYVSGEELLKAEQKADIAFLKAQEVDFTNGRIIYNEKVSDISV